MENKKMCCYKCKEQLNNKDLVHKCDVRGNLYFCSECFSYDYISCELCGQNHVENLTTIYSELNSYDQWEDCYACYSCAEKELNLIKCEECLAYSEETNHDYTIRLDMAMDKNFCSKVCLNNYGYSKCRYCSTVDKSTEFYYREKIKHENIVGYSCYKCGKCKKCNKQLDKENYNSAYKDNFCSNECKHSKEITKFNMLEVFLNEEKKYLKSIVENNSVRKVKVARDIYNVSYYLNKNGFYAKYLDKVLFLYKFDDKVLYIGQSFIYCQDSILGRKGWLYNYNKGIDLSVLKQMATKDEKLKLILELYNGYILKRI